MFGLTTKKQKERELQMLREELNAKLEEKEAELASRNTELENVRTSFSEKCAAFDILEKEHMEMVNNPEILHNALVDERICEISETLKKTKKELENTEDELEDLQDDYKDECKKHQHKKELYEELQKKFSSLESENKIVSEKLQSVEQKSEMLSKDLFIKDGSLGFVREILNAKTVSKNGKMKKLYDDIYKLVSFIQGDFRDCNNEIFGEAPDEMFGYGCSHWKLISQKSWLKNKKTIAFVGEFSAGKTSIVNKILSNGGSNLSLPVSTKATTAIPTYISGTSAASISYNFFTPDNELKTLSEKTFRSIDKTTLAEIDGISNLIKYFVMACNNKNLKDLSILDTPGFSSSDKEDAIRTTEVIDECDALFWVFDVNVGTVNRSSLKIIKEHLSKPLFVIINKIDTKPKGEVDKVEELLKKTFSTENIPVESYIRFSDREDPKVLLEALDNVERSNDTSYIADLKDFVKSNLNVLKEKFAEASKAEKRSDKEKDSASETVNAELEHIRTDLAEIAEKAIASYEVVSRYEKNHWFTDDKYEIPVDVAKNTLFSYTKSIKDESQNLSSRTIDELDGEIQYYSGLSKVNFKHNCEKEELKYQKTKYEKYVDKLWLLCSPFNE